MLKSSNLNLVYENECLDDLQLNSLFLIQKQSGFKFGIDAVLLSSIVKAKSEDTVFDLCTGTGVIPILLSAKIRAKNYVAIEIDEDMADMAHRSVVFNSLQDRIAVKCMDVKKIAQGQVFDANIADVITVNPPYFKRGSSILNEDSKKYIARHEVCLSLEELFENVEYLLKDRGNLYMIHRPDRLVDIFELGRKYKLEPKWIQFVYPKRGKPANLVLLRFTKGGNPELKFEKNLYVYDEFGNYTEDIDRIYNRT